jgi:type IV pilus assembly protein PilN
MITINLLGDDRVRSASGKLLIFGYAASIIFFFAIFFFTYQGTSSSITKLTQDQDELEERLNKLKQTTKEVHKLEDMQNELKSKLSVIATLKKSKRGPVRVLDDLNNALPEKAWITEINEHDGVLSVSGFALDNPTIAQFLRDLDLSDYFEDVELGETKNAEREGITIKAFTINSKVNYSGIVVPPPDAVIDVKAKTAAAPKAAVPEAKPAKKGSEE